MGCPACLGPRASLSFRSLLNTTVLISGAEALAAGALAWGFLVLRSLRKELEVSKSSYDRLRKAVESSSDAIGIGDEKGNSVYHNQAHIDLFGYTVEELNAVPGGGVLFGDPVVAQEVFEAIQARRSWVGETVVNTRDGRSVPAFVRADAIIGDDGQLAGIFGVFSDITERLKAERVIEEQRQRMAATLESISDSVITVDAGCRVILMNPAAEQLTGYEAAKSVGKHLREVLLIADEKSREHRELPVETLIREETSSRSADVYILISENGAERVIAEYSSITRDKTGKVSGAVLAMRDVTRERRRATEEARASKLESLGLLAGGIAHDFGNLLTALVGNIALVQMSSNLTPQTIKRLEDMDRIAWRARDLTQQLLIFAKGGTPEKKIVTLEPLIREASAFAAANTPVILTFNIEPNLWPVSADEGQLIQVINNLAVNAVQAMAKGGTLAISAVNVRPDRGSATPSTDGRWVDITIADNGSGISPENLQKIFEPFFTTKPKGTGLGLATCYSIVKKHGGQLRVDSQLGVGTTFHIVLPAAEVAKGPSAEREPRGSKGRILVMDDDRQMRETMALMLSLTGYESADAEEGGEAIKKFDAAREGGRPFDLVFLDIRVPHGLGGRETLHELIKRDPKVRAIASSGHPDDPVMLDYLGNGFVGCLPKPFKIDALRSALSTILKERS